MNNRPLTTGAGSSAVPKTKAKTKAAKTDRSEKHPKSSAPSTSALQVRAHSSKSKDSEIEELEMKRKAVLMRNRWADKITALDVEVSMSVQRAEPYDDCTECFGFKGLLSQS